MSGHVRVEALVIPTIYNFLKKLLDSVPYYRPYITSECSFNLNQMEANYATQKRRSLQMSER